MSNFDRKRIYKIVRRTSGPGLLSAFYDYFMIVVIVVSLIPLAFKADRPVFSLIDRVTVVIFIIDYLLRWLTADYKYPNRPVYAFLLYPFSPMAIVDLISILPSLSILHDAFKLLRLFRMLRAMRVLRVFRAMRYSRSFEVIENVLHNSRQSLMAVCALAGGYILISALVIFNVEPETFETFFDAVYWATVSLTTVGYGDIYPVSTLGRVITMISSLFGIAIVALPAGIITAGYMTEVEKMNTRRDAVRRKNRQRLKKIIRSGMHKGMDEKKPARKQPVEKNPPVKNPGERMLTEMKPVEKALAEKKAAEKKPVGEKPAARYAELK